MFFWWDEVAFNFVGDWTGVGISLFFEESLLEGSEVGWFLVVLVVEGIDIVSGLCVLF